MKGGIRKQDVMKLVGKQVYAVKKDGTFATGKLVKISGSKLFLEQPKGKKVRTKAVIPLVLFDLLAIGTTPFGFGGGFGGFGPGFGYGGYPGVGYGGGFGYGGYPGIW